MLYVIVLTIHIISIVIWIGGVAFVTMITFPMIQRAGNSLEQVMMFQGVEHRFSKIAKIMVILVGLSGLYLIYEKYGFNFKELGFGVWIMIIVWVFYASLLFGLEKIIFKKMFSTPSRNQVVPTGEQPDLPTEQAGTKKIFNKLQRFHWVVLALSFLAIAAGIWTAHY
jgi:uncharacterized membrane protein